MITTEASLQDRAGGQALILVDAVPPTSADPGGFERLVVVRRVATAAGLTIIHVWTVQPDQPPPLPHPDLAPEPGEILISTVGPGAWSSGELGRTLARLGVGSIVLAGPADRPGWAASLSQAAATDLAVTVLSDGVADHDAQVRWVAGSRPNQRPFDLEDAGAWVAAAAAPKPRRRRRRMILLVALLLAVLVIAGAAVTTQRGAQKYYEYSPGSAPTITASADCRTRSAGAGSLTLPDGQPCARLVVPAGKEHAISGRLSMVDVLVGPASPWDYLLQRVHLLKTFRDGSQLVPAADVLGNTPAGQLACQDNQQMTGSTENASVSALSRLGYSVTASNLGAQVNLVQPGSAAAAAGLQCNDVVTAVDGTAIVTAADLKAAITAQKPGASVRVTVRRTAAGGRITTKTLIATLTGTPAVPASPGQAAVPGAPDQAFLGVGTRTQTTYTLPFDVSIQVGDIGGPSAGLALTLGLLDVLSNGNLTGGLHVAATGTISPDGTVGAVGGVAQKAVAVRRAGAQIFLVPADNAAEARSEAGTHLRVLAVGSLQQALTDLEQAGGHLGPLARQPAATAAPATGG